MKIDDIEAEFNEAFEDDLNYFEVLGTDRKNDSEQSFGEDYFNYRKEWSERLYRNDPGDFPLHVDIESTNRCNLRCSMCQIDFDNMKQGNIDPDLFKKIIKECGENKLSSLKLNYRGEPTMNKNLPQFVKMAKDEGIIEVQINTNGLLINEKFAESLIDAGLDRIKFSVDGATPEIYEKIRGASYAKLIKNIENFIRIRNEKGLIRPIVHVQMVYMQDNKAEAVKFYNFWKDKVNRIGFSRYRSPERKINDSRRALESPDYPVPCSQLWQRLLVTYNGDILMCCGDHLALNILGNASRTTLKEVWNSDTLRNYRKLHLDNESNLIKACSICEVNKTDYESSQKIWKKVKNNV